MAALACPAILLWVVLLHLLSAAASAFGGRVLEVTDRDLSSERELLALYHRWLSLYRPHDSAAGGENVQPPRRFHVFKENALYIHRANRRANVSYELGLNKFADLTNEEFRSLYTRSSAKIARRQPERKRGFLHEDSAAILPQSVDWRTKGAVTGVKDQGDCGSCWAFSTVAAVEGINQIRGGELVSLSEQELVDCDREENAGCDGGLMDYAFQFIVDSGGISTERDYPYTATDGGRCNTTKDSRAIVIDGYEDVPTGNMSGLLKAVSQQPVSVAIEASSIQFQFYWRGVFTGGCGTNLDHGVAIVGYGESNWGTEYWIVKNSWGLDWGEEGYIRVERKEGKGLCGINMLGSYPIKISPNPLPQTNKKYPQALLTRKTGLFPSH